MILYPGEAWIKSQLNSCVATRPLFYFAFIPIEAAVCFVWSVLCCVEVCRQTGSAQSSDFSGAVLSLPRTVDPSLALVPAVALCAVFSWCGDYTLEVQGHPSQFKDR